MVAMALIGAGRIGQLHAGNLAGNSKVELVAIADVVAPAAEALAAQHGTRARSVDAVIADDGIDAVLIASSTDTHADLIEQAARAGKAIFCEKPIDLDTARARQAVTVAEECGVALAIGFNRRFDSHFASLKARIEAGEIGELETVSIISRDPSPPALDYLATSGGLFRDMMIHDFDMARWLTGEDVVELHAMSANLIDPAIGEVGDVDTAIVMMRMTSGRLCQITTSRRAAYGYDQRIECHGSLGMARAENVTLSTVEVARADGFRRDPAEPFFLERYDAAYKAELAHFVECIQAGKPAGPTGSDGIAALELADAAAHSADTGKPIRLAAPG
jgi:myo-inositol 2-dehydrogenase / D-chiro-inositol 1-dehydrogenase